MSMRRLGKRSAVDNAGVSSKANGAPSKKPQSLLTVAEAAEILNTCERTVRRYIAKGDLRAIKIGRLVRIDPIDLEDFIRDRRNR